MQATLWPILSWISLPWQYGFVKGKYKEREGREKGRATVQLQRWRTNNNGRFQHRCLRCWCNDVIAVFKSSCAQTDRQTDGQKSDYLISTSWCHLMRVVPDICRSSYTVFRNNDPFLFLFHNSLKLWAICMKFFTSCSWINTNSKCFNKTWQLIKYSLLVVM